MRINHNIAALNTQNQLGQANKAQQDSMEKLSSGLRINSASDDAAGLAISEKMRGQIRGLEQAETNAQDANSMIQTAEGALNESHSILQRMRELSVQSANDTNTDDDRAELQQEVNQLSEELTRIGDNTEFNTQTLLEGEFEGEFQIGANEGQNISVNIGDMRAESLGVGSETALTESDTVTVEGLANESVLETDDGTNIAVEADDGDFYKMSDVELGDSDPNNDGTDDILVAKDGAEATGYTDGSNIGIDISSQEGADEAISTIDDAIGTVSSQRSELGAVQNRLDHTINNLSTSSENLTAAESRIRDVDYDLAAA